MDSSQKGVRIRPLVQRSHPANFTLVGFVLITPHGCVGWTSVIARVLERLAQDGAGLLQPLAGKPGSFFQVCNANLRIRVQAGNPVGHCSEKSWKIIERKLCHFPAE
jgi:hypothetical protein